MDARVLVVEDDAVNRHTLSTLLEHMGHRPIVTERGEDALRLLAAHNDIDVVISDVVISGMDGMELARRAMAVRPGLPVILVTGDGDAMESVLANGAVALLKPYSAETLQRVVAEALEAPG